MAWEITEKEIPDPERRKAVQAGVDAISESIMELVEVCIRQRIKQTFLVIEESMRK